jgi:hypothetical protein
MTEEITNLVLLEHMQAMKHDLQLQITALDRRLTGKIDGLGGRMDRFEARIEQGFQEARAHRQELQADLDATINMLMKHDKKLARL